MSSAAAPQPAQPPKGDGGARTVQIVGDWIKSQLDAHRSASSHGKDPVPPLFVGVQGPQGCGKSYLTSLLPPYLSAGSSPISCASLSLDDLYLPHAGLDAVASAHPDNKLVQGRGQPGTHDLPLGESVIASLKRGEPVDLPVFDKSRFSGQGDRSEEVVKVDTKVDVVIFEGWMLGFGALGDGEIARRWSDPAAFAKQLDYDEPFLRGHKVEDLEFINEELKKYTKMWSAIDCFVMLRPISMSYVWEWRLQQEHNMKAKNGGIGMTDEQVKAFIGRYMPGYELFLEGIESPSTTWKGKGLKLSVARSRDITATEPF